MEPCYCPESTSITATLPENCIKTNASLNKCTHKIIANVGTWNDANAKVNVETTLSTIRNDLTFSSTDESSKHRLSGQLGKGGQIWDIYDKEYSRDIDRLITMYRPDEGAKIN